MKISMGQATVKLLEYLFQYLKLSAGLIAVLIGAPASRAQSADERKPRVNVNSNDKVDYQALSAGQWKSGEQIYQSFCTYCHSTGIGPNILGRHYSPVALKVFVRNGVNTMPTFRVTEFNDQELDLLAKWVEQSSPTSATKAEGIK